MNAPQSTRSAFQALAALRGHVPPKIRTRALDYAGAVMITRCSSTELCATVAGTEIYAVEVERDGNIVRFACSCPYFDDRLEICKHAWAAITSGTTRGFLSETPVGRPLRLQPWEQSEVRISYLTDDDVDEDDEDDDDEEDGDADLGAANEPKEKPSAQPRSQWEKALQSSLASLPEKDSPRRNSDRPVGVFFEIDTARLQRDGDLILQIVFETATATGKIRLNRTGRLRLEEVVESLPAELTTALAMLWGAGSEHLYSFATYREAIPSSLRVPTEIAPLVLPHLCADGRLRIPAFGIRKERRLSWDAGPPWELALTLTPGDGGRVALDSEIRRGDARLSWDEVLVAGDHGLLVTNTFIGRVDGRGGKPIMDMLEDEDLAVTPADVPRFIDRLLEFPDLPSIATPPELGIATKTAQPTPAIRVKQEPSAAGYRASVSFHYGDRTVAGHERRSGWCDEATATIVRRDPVAEAAACARLVELGFRAVDGERGELGITGKRLPAALRSLMAAGWQVTADGKLFRPAGKWTLSVNSSVDWFDLEGGLEFNGEIVPLPKLLAAARKGEKTIVLGDGSLGMLPEDWMKKYGGLAGLGAANGDHVRFSHGQAGLLDALLAAQEDVRIDEAFSRARERLRTFEKIVPAREPEDFVGELRPYQREGLAWLEFLEEFGVGGCLADDMGLGKTVEVLAWLAGRERNGPVLIVCPRSLVFNWKAEARRFTPWFHVLDHTGPDRRAPGPHFGEHDFVIATYGILRRDAALLSKLEFDAVILDEAQAIKNRETDAAKAARLLRARHRLVMSGTPVENRLAELGSLFEFLNPGILGTTAAFDGLAGAGDPDALATLARGLRPFILRRTKEQVVKDLPTKTEQTISCELEGAHRKLYDELRDHYRGALLGKLDAGGPGGSKIQILEALLRLRQAACHPGLIDKTRAGESSPKVDLLLDRLDEVVADGHKALVFSQFTSLLAIVKKQLDARAISYEYLDGKTRDRESRVSRFRTDPSCPLFLISLKAGGVGLNLVEADYVFLLDPWWNPAVEAQAIDRTHRIGQTRSVFAYRLIARDTVEEKVLELQSKKRALADAIIRADESLIRALTRDDLELLLS